jgi:hypothetical protein
LFYPASRARIPGAQAMSSPRIRPPSPKLLGLSALATLALFVPGVWPAFAAGGRAADDLVGIAMAPGSDAGVAWSVRNIRSLDGARVFLPGTEDVAAVAMAADGTVYAIRGRTRFGVAAPHAEAVWHDLPVTGKTKGFAVIGDRVAWFAATATGNVLTMTADRGRHWSTQTMPDDVDHGRLRLLAGGALELFGRVLNCHSGDYSVRYRGRIGSNKWRLAWSGAETEYRGPSQFGTSDDDYEGPFNGADEFIRGEGQAVVFWIRPNPAQLVSLRDGESEQRLLSEQLPAGLSLITVDAQGRPLGVTKSKVWRWSPAKRWQALGPR